VNTNEVLDALRAQADPSRLLGMARVGIETSHALGVSVPAIRKIAKRAGTDQRLAKELWATEVHEARMVAALVVDPEPLTLRAMTAWTTDLDSWDLTDMLADTFAMLARLAVDRPGHPDATYLGYLPVIRAAATDDRNEVKKAVNWALRQIGKRNRALNQAAIAEADALLELNDRTARWIARDALRELRNPATVVRIPR
jgi:3-methyladenine DNA glycosylase AlkD